MPHILAITLRHFMYNVPMAKCIRNFTYVQLTFYITCLARNKYNFCAYLKTMPNNFHITRSHNTYTLLLAWFGGINMCVAFIIKCSPYTG